MIAWLLATALAAPLLLDAGGAASPVLPDFSRLDLVGSTDPRASWATPPRSAAWQAAPDALAGDFVDGGVLHLALEPGSWAFHVLIGQEGRGYSFPVPIGGAFGVRADGVVAWSAEVPSGDGFLDSPWYAADPFPVFRPGETAWDRLIAPHHAWRAFEVDVPEGGIDLEVFGVPLQGLVATRSVAEGEVLVAIADARRRAWYHERVDTAADTWTWPFPEDGPLRASVGTWLDLPDPDAASARPVVDRAVAPDERVGMVWWLFPGDGSATVTIEGLDAIGAVAHEVHALDAAHHALRAVRPRPAFLRPIDGEVRGGQGFPVGVAITGRVAADARPGVIEGRVRVTRGDETLDLPVRLRVRALDLVDPPAPVGVFADLRHPLTMAYGAGSPEVWAAFDRDVALMRERGFTVLGVRFATTWPGAWATTAPPDTSLFEEAARRWRAQGGDTLVWLDPIPWLLDSYYRNVARPLDAPVRAVLRGLAEAAVAHDALLYTYDEGAMYGFERVPRAAEIATVLREEVPAVRLAGGEMHPLGWDLAGPYDVIMVAPVPPMSSAIVADIEARGADAWVYNPARGRPGAGLTAFVTGADAAITWHWNDAQGDPFHDAHLRRQWQMALLAPGGQDVWPTPLLESYAEGVTDQRYLATLDALVAEALWADPRRVSAAAPGQRLLDVVRQVDGAPAMGIVEGGVWADPDLDRLRDAVGDAAEALSACLAKRRACPRPVP